MEEKNMHSVREERKEGREKGGGAKTREKKKEREGKRIGFVAVHWKQKVHVSVSISFLE